MDLNKLDLASAIKGLTNKEFSTLDLIEACFKRIEMVDPKIHAFLALNKDQAIKEASDPIVKDKTLMGRMLEGLP